MAQVLKVDEWQSPSGRWYVADVHTWTGWRECADILGAETLVDYIDILYNKYNATISGTIGVKNEEPANVLFSWPAEEYRYAHQFKLDVNRIARKKNYMVERSF
jgi:hypothetical protein